MPRAPPDLQTDARVETKSLRSPGRPRSLGFASEGVSRPLPSEGSGRRALPEVTRWRRTRGLCAAAGGGPAWAGPGSPGAGGVIPLGAGTPLHAYHLPHPQPRREQQVELPRARSNATEPRAAQQKAPECTWAPVLPAVGWRGPRPQPTSPWDLRLRPYLQIGPLRMEPVKDLTVRSFWILAGPPPNGRFPSLGPQRRRGRGREEEGPQEDGQTLGEAAQGPGTPGRPRNPQRGPGPRPRLSDSRLPDALLL